MKRALDANPGDFQALSSRELIEAVRLSEGRILVAEVVATAPPLVDKVSNVELAAAFGADIILLNLYNVNSPAVMGMPDIHEVEGKPGAPTSFGKFQTGKGRTLADVKAWTGRPVGINLEPLPQQYEGSREGREATAANALSAVEQGADLLVITGNPATGVSASGIASSVKRIRESVSDRAIILAGKAHAAGVRAPLVEAEDLHSYLTAGADGVLLPAPGTAPGMTLDACRELVSIAHELDGLALSAIGTSQEGSSRSVIEQIALMSKMTGAEMHHIGDAGLFGIAVPENIYTYSMTLRGRRHTWHRMAASLRR
jgi:hypothetical protein